MLLDFFRRLVKGKQKYGAIKFFRTVNLEEAQKFKSVEVIDFCVSKLLSIFKEDIRSVELNYGNKSWKKYSSFKKFIEKNSTYPIAEYSSFIKDSYSGALFFGNEKLNRIKLDDTTDVIDIIITFPSEIICIDFLRDFLGKLFSVERFDYGYVCFLPKNYSVITERKESANNAKDIEPWENLININNGYIKSIYPINILNNVQIEKNNILSYISNGTGILHEIKDSNLKILEILSEI
jgi:hypothetical protein